MAYACNGYDGALLNGLQSLPQWNFFFGDPSGAYLGLLTSGINIGTVAAHAPLCDWLSRCVPIYIGILFIILVLLWELPHNKLDRSLQAESWSVSEVLFVWLLRQCLSVRWPIHLNVLVS